MSQGARTTGKSLVTWDRPQLPAIVISMSRSASLQTGGAAASQPGSPIYLAWSGRASALPSPMPLLSENDDPADLTNAVYPLSSHDSVVGGLGDVSKAIWKKGSKRYLVAVKHIRPPNNTLDRRDKTEKRLRREIAIWSRLDHPNIVPLFGTISPGDGRHVAGMVSAWMKHGNLSDYLAIELLTVFERINILCEVASGIEYLHSQGIIHGDLSGSNILINENRHACLGDFGLSAIQAESEGIDHWTSTIGGAIRWRAPELLPSMSSDVYTFRPDLSWRCDIYSFGSVMLQVLSNTIPYAYITRAECVLIELFRRQPPRRPESHILSNEYWSFIKRCWGDEPKSRPLAKDLLTSILDLRDATIPIF